MTQRYLQLLVCVKRFVRPPIDAENIAAELWMEELLEGKHHILTSVRNRCIDAIRREQVRGDYETAASQGYYGRHEAVQEHVDYELLSKAFNAAGFDTITRSILYRRYWCDENVVQISSGLRIGLNEVRVRLTEALRILRTTVRKEDHE